MRGDGNMIVYIKRRNGEYFSSINYEDEEFEVEDLQLTQFLHSSKRNYFDYIRKLVKRLGTRDLCVASFMRTVPVNVSELIGDFLSLHYHLDITLKENSPLAPWMVRCLRNWTIRKFEVYSMMDFPIDYNQLEIQEFVVKGYHYNGDEEKMNGLELINVSRWSFNDCQFEKIPLKQMLQNHSIALKPLHTIRISNCVLHDVDLSIFQNFHGRVLSLRFNDITSTKGLEHFRGDTLDLSFNFITDLTGMDSFNGRVLNLATNRIKDPSLLKDFHGEELNLSGNKIEQVDAFAHFKGSKLILASNEIIDVSSLRHFKGTLLNVRMNFIYNFEPLLDIWSVVECGFINDQEEMKFHQRALEERKRIQFESNNFCRKRSFSISNEA